LTEFACFNFHKSEAPSLNKNNIKTIKAYEKMGFITRRNVAGFSNDFFSYPGISKGTKT